MRRVLCLLALGLLAVAGASEVSGQTTRLFPPGARASTMNQSARTVINKPIDTSLAVAPFPTQKGNFFSNLFRKPSFTAMQSPLNGKSNLPLPDTFKSTKYKNSFVPLPPVIPGQKQ